jgi:hypothetical protein
MKFKQIIDCFFVLFMVIFFYECKNVKTIKYQDTGKIKISTTLKHNVDSLLHNSDCLAIRISKDGFCCTTDASVSTHFLYPNSVTYSHTDTSRNVVLSFYPYFAFAYLNKRTQSVCIVLQNSNSGDNARGVNSIFNIEKKIDADFSIAYTNEFRSQYQKRETIKYRAQVSEVVLDKTSYEVGDTIRGYMYYKGLDQRINKRWEVYKIWFRCVIGTSSDPKDYIDTYPKCSTIVNEVGFGKRRNIIPVRTKSK